MKGEKLSLEARVQRDSLERALFGRAPGVNIGRIRLLRRIFRRSRGTLFEALDIDSQRRVAVLAAPAGVAAPERRWLERAARQMLRVAHTNTVAVSSVGDFEGQLLVTTEFVNGPALGEWLVAAKPTREQILAVFGQIAGGLEAAHKVGVVPRDFGPDCVLVAPDGVPKIWPFNANEDAAASPYTAPEVRAGHDADERSTQFSVCALLFEALCGRPPASVSDVAAAPLPPWLRTAITRGLQVEPARRFGSMRALRRALQPQPVSSHLLWAVPLAVGLALAASTFALDDEEPKPDRTVEDLNERAEAPVGQGRTDTVPLSAQVGELWRDIRAWLGL